MASPDLDDPEDKPLDPSVERVRRKLLRFMVINLGLLFVALMAVVIAVVYKSRTEETDAPAVATPLAPGETRSGAIVLPRDAEILGQSLSGERISLHLRLPDGSQSILLYDMARGAVIGRFAIMRE